MPISPPFVVAEVGSNHNQNLDRCLRLIDAAADAGCGAVKFQLFDEDLYAPGFEHQRQTLKQQALPHQWLDKIINHCDNSGLMTQWTVFSPKQIKLICDHITIPFLKIGSYEILNIKLIKLAAGVTSDLSLSLGNGNRFELTRAVEAASLGDKLPFIYHCSPKYPTAPKDCRLYHIALYKYIFPCAGIGWSDHSGVPEAIFDAVVYGASRVELHLDLDDMQGAESVHGHCWSASVIKSLLEVLPEKAEQILASREGAPMSIPCWQPFEGKELMWRADPSDGMRPLKKHRAALKEE